MRIIMMLAATMALVLSGARAYDCTCTCDPATVTTPATGIDITHGGPSSGSGIYYLENDACQPDCLFSIRIYQESNGIDGLQRADELVDDTCGGEIPADTIIF